MIGVFDISGVYKLFVNIYPICPPPNSNLRHCAEKQKKGQPNDIRVDVLTAERTVEGQVPAHPILKQHHCCGGIDWRFAENVLRQMWKNPLLHTSKILKYTLLKYILSRVDSDKTVMLISFPECIV